MKKFVLVLCITSLLLCACARRTEPLLQPDESLYVTDRAQVLSEETREQLLSHIAALKAACGGEIAVVTLDFLKDLTIQEYARRLMNDWGVGDGKKNNGCLLLLVIGEESYYLLPGYGIEDDLSADLIDLLLKENLAPKFAVGDYDAGVLQTVNALLNWYCGYYNVSLYTGAQSSDPIQQLFGGGHAGDTGISAPTWVWIVGAAVLAFLILKVFSSFSSGGR